MGEQVNVGGVWSVYSDCITCGIRYTVPSKMWNKQREQGGFHHCPNGHSQGWDKENSEISNLRRDRDRLKQRLAEKDDAIYEVRGERDRSNRQAAAYKGHVTRVRNRVGKGVCPCCNRTFQNLARHMGSQHPDYAQAAEKVA